MSFDSPCVVLSGEADTAALGAALADTLRQLQENVRQHGLHIALEGDLGAGKTTLVRGLLRQLGVGGAVKSPTFALLEPYVVSSLHLYHFDFYRFKTPREFLDGGFAEYFGPGTVCLVEWPERAQPYLPQVDLHIGLRVLETGRSAQLVSGSPMGKQCLERLWKAFNELPKTTAGDA